MKLKRNLKLYVLIALLLLSLGLALFGPACAKDRPGKGISGPWFFGGVTSKNRIVPDSCLGFNFAGLLSSIKSVKKGQDYP